MMNQIIRHMKLGVERSNGRYQINSNDLFIIAFCLYSITLLIESTTITAILPSVVLLVFKAVRYFSYALCVLKTLIAGRYKGRQIIYGCLLVLIAAITLYTSDRTLAMLVFIFVGAVDAPKDRVIKHLLRIQIVALSATVVGSLLGIIDNYLFDSFRGRWGLGFIWTTFAPILFMFITIEYIYLNNHKVKMLHFIILGSIATFFYLTTKTRLAYVTTMFFIAISAVEHYKKKPWRIIKRIGKWNAMWPLVFMTVAVLLQISYKSDSITWQKLDLLLSRRLYYGANAINEYGITAFGQKIEWIGRSYNTELKGLVPSNDLIDNAYLRNLFLYGVVGLAAILSLYCIGIWKAVQNADYILVWIYVVILGFCIFELWMYNLQFNPFALVSVMSFTHTHKWKEVDQKLVIAT